MSDVSFTFEGDPTDAARAAEEVERALEELSRQAIQTGATMRAALTRMHAPLDDTADKIDGATKAMDRNTSATGRMRRGMGDLERGILRTNRGFSFFRNIIGLIRWPAMITAVGFLAQALVAAAAGATALVSALAPLVGVFAALPAAVFTLVGAVTSVKLAFSDLKEALDGNAEAIKRLTPEGRRFASVLNGLKGLVRDIRRDAQQGLFPGLEEALRSTLTAKNVSTFRGFISGISGALGEAAAGVGRTLGRRGGDLGFLSRENVTLMDRMAALTPALTRAFLSLSVTAAPLVRHLTGIIERFVDWIDKSVAAGRASGALNRFFEQTAAVLDRVISLAVNFGGALKNIADAGGSALGRRMLDDLDTAADHLERITGSVEGQNQLAGYFERAQGPIYETARLVRDIGLALARLGATPGLEQLIRLVRVELVPAFENLFAQATASFGPALVTALSEVLRLMSQFVGPTGPLTVFVRLIGDAARGLADFGEQHPKIFQLAVNISSIAAILKAISFAAAISGLTRFRRAIGLTRTNMQRLNTDVAATGPTATASSTVAVGAMGRIGLAAVRLGRIIRFVLIRTGLGLLIVAAGEMAYQLIFHMDRVKRVWTRIWNEIVKFGYQKFLEFIEPFTHIPEFFGGLLGKMRDYAQEAKAAVTGRMQELSIEMAVLGQKAGAAWGLSFIESAAPAFAQMQRWGNQVTGVPGGGPGTAGTPGRGRPGGRTGRGIQVPTGFRSTHETSGLGGYPAKDFPGTVGQNVLAPEDGEVYRLSGKDPSAGSVKGGPGGWSLYYRGHETGNDYYMTHLGNPRPRLGFYREGDIIAVIGPHVSGPHVHVGIRRRANKPTKAPKVQGPKPSTTPSFDTDPGAAFGFTPSMPTGPGGAKPPGLTAEEKDERTVTTAERTPLLRQYRRLLAQLRNVIPPGTRARLQKQLRAIGEAIKDAVRDSDLERAEQQLEKWRGNLKAALDTSEQIRELRKNLGTLRAEIMKLPENMRGPLLARMKAINAILSQRIVTPADIERVRNRIDKLATAIEERVAEMEEKLQDMRDRISSAWEGVASKALEIFDAQTEEMVKQARLPFDALTPAEQALKALQDRRRQLTRETDLADAESELAFALRVGDPDLIRQAHARITEIQLDAEEERLQSLADQERAAADAAADAEEKRIRDERQFTRDRFEARLAEIILGFQNEGATYDQAMAQITGLLGEFGVSFEAAGALVGSYFATGFINQIVGVATGAALILGQIAGQATGVANSIHGQIMGAIGSVMGKLPQARAGAYVASDSIVSLHANEAVLPLSDSKAMAAIVDALGGAGGGTTVFNFPNYVGSQQDLERAMIQALRDYDRRNGGVPIRIRS